MSEEEPVAELPPEGWKYFRLWKRVREAVFLLKDEFKSTVEIGGLHANELYSFGEVLGFTIEAEVVRCLNNLRRVWDPGNVYANFAFKRQAQTFPDVILAGSGPTKSEIVLGIELKSWYVLAKEGEPSFRFKTNVAACPAQDLMLLVPWCLSNVLSGRPVIFDPYVGATKYLAQYRNYWWKHKRRALGSTAIREPSNVTPYPNARDNISDEPVSDKGGNFGRISRIGLLDAYVEKLDSTVISGIRVSDWRAFFKEHG